MVAQILLIVGYCLLLTNAECPTGDFESGDKCFRLINEVKDCQSMKSHCASEYLGTIAVVDKQEDFNFIKNQINDGDPYYLEIKTGVKSLLNYKGSGGDVEITVPATLPDACVYVTKTGEDIVLNAEVGNKYRGICQTPNFLKCDIKTDSSDCPPNAQGQIMKSYTFKINAEMGNNIGGICKINVDNRFASVSKVTGDPQCNWNVTGTVEQRKCSEEYIVPCKASLILPIFTPLVTLSLLLVQFHYK